MLDYHIERREDYFDWLLMIIDWLSLSLNIDDADWYYHHQVERHDVCRRHDFIFIAINFHDDSFSHYH